MVVAGIVVGIIVSVLLNGKLSAVKRAKKRKRSTIKTNKRINTMFKDTTAFSSFSVDEVAKAKQFYGTTLGLDVADDPHMPDLLNLHLSGGALVMVYPKGEQHVPASFTVLNFVVKDIDETVDALTAAGVKFENYPNGPAPTDTKGIARGKEGFGPSIAWFKDPAGNILSVIQDS